MPNGSRNTASTDAATNGVAATAGLWGSPMKKAVASASDATMFQIRDVSRSLTAWEQAHGRRAARIYVSAALAADIAEHESIDLHPAFGPTLGSALGLVWYVDEDLTGDSWRFE